VNWQKQEDAVLLNWNADASLVLQAAEPMDLTPYSQLVFDLKWSAAPTAPLWLGMSCGSGCGGQLDLAAVLQQKPTEQWHKLSIDLRCLANAGAALNHLYQPFRLQSSGAWQASLANIRLIPNTQGSDLSCN